MQHGALLVYASNLVEHARMLQHQDDTRDCFFFYSTRAGLDNPGCLLKYGHYWLKWNFSFLHQQANGSAVATLWHECHCWHLIMTLHAVEDSSALYLSRPNRWGLGDERVAEELLRRPPLARVLLEAALDEVSKLLRCPRWRARRVPEADGAHQCGPVWPLPRPGRHGEVAEIELQQGARADVGVAGVEGPAHDLADPEIGDLDLHFPVHEEIRGLDVAVDDLVGVEDGVEGADFHILHDDGEAATARLLDDTVAADDLGVISAAEDLHLAVDLASDDGVAVVTLDHLESVDGGGAAVADLVDSAAVAVS
ncbi:hypothetical protein SAY87_004310 [Trapa incisa]|uniref:Uncharacterized protein n=1 Tax=Trapa incisa TaxID=236973 RepID=A0AAN7PM20_9MYRT|nr:hypothetical protein SAY87_004310 [Trapa incisa]